MHDRRRLRKEHNSIRLTHALGKGVVAICLVLCKCVAYILLDTQSACRDGVVSHPVIRLVNHPFHPPRHPTARPMVASLKTACRAASLQYTAGSATTTAGPLTMTHTATSPPEAADPPWHDACHEAPPLPMPPHPRHSATALAAWQATQHPQPIPQQPMQHCLRRFEMGFLQSTRPPTAPTPHCLRHSGMGFLQSTAPAIAPAATPHYHKRSETGFQR